MWISLALHAAVVGLVQLAPPVSVGTGETVFEAQLAPVAPRATAPVEPVSGQAPVPTPPVPAPPAPPLTLAPSETAEPMPVARPQPAAPAPPGPVPPVPAVPAPVPPASPPPAVESPITITSAVDLNYYSARELDAQPRALRKIVPVYPAGPDRDRISGTVRLQLKLEADGRVSDVEVVTADPPDLFDESALKAFRNARFRPAKRGGRPVRALIQIEVVYDWDGRQ